MGGAGGGLARRSHHTAVQPDAVWKDSARSMPVAASCHEMMVSAPDTSAVAHHTAGRSGKRAGKAAAAATHCPGAGTACPAPLAAPAGARRTARRWPRSKCHFRAAPDEAVSGAAGHTARRRRRPSHLRERALNQRRPLVLPLPAVDQLVQLGPVARVRRPRFGRHRAQRRAQAADALERRCTPARGATAQHGAMSAAERAESGTVRRWVGGKRGNESSGRQQAARCRSVKLS